MWDIEGELCDTKTYDSAGGDRQVAAGTPIHGMQVRLTIDDSATIREIAAAMDFTPFGECQQGKDPMQRLVGVTLGRGWRKSIESALGGAQGCTHLREMLFNMATVAFQCTASYRAAQRTTASDLEAPPPQYGRCIALAFDGAVAARRYPQFAGREPIRIVEKKL